MTVLGILAFVGMVAVLTALWRGARLRAQNRSGRIASGLSRNLDSHPGAGAGKLERLIWTRRFCLKTELPSIVVLILVAVAIDKSWVFVSVGVFVLIAIGSMIDLSLAIRRERVS